MHRSKGESFVLLTSRAPFKRLESIFLLNVIVQPLFSFCLNLLCDTLVLIEGHNAVVPLLVQ